MNAERSVASSRAQTALATNNVLRNTYILLSLTLLFSAAVAATSMALALPYPGLIITMVGYFGLLFAVEKTKNSSKGLFFGLSAYALASGRRFNQWAGALFAGILVAFLLGIGAAIFHIPALSLAVSALFILLMSGLILYQTGEIINGGETNYITATVTLFVSLYNMFLSLLSILGFALGDD